MPLDDAGEQLDQAAGPEQYALAADVAAQVRRAVAALPRDQRAALTAVVYEGLSVSEVAQAADVAEGTIKSRVHRARARIAKELRW